MSVVSRRGSSWQASLMCKGRRIRRQFRSAAEAHDWLRRAEAQVVLGENPSLGGRESGRTLRDALNATIDDVWEHRRSGADLTANGRSVVEILGGDRPLESIDGTAVRAVVSALSKRGLANGTINRKIAALSKILRHAHDLGIIDRVPKLTRLPERQGRVRWLTRDEEAEVVARFRHLGRPRMALLVEWLADTGMRVGEALRLRWEDLNAVGDMLVATVWESKSGSSRSVPLTTRCRRVVEEMDRGRAGDGPFTRISQDAFNKEWVLVRRDLGKADDDQFVPHALRHTCASRMVQAGVELLVVRELLGHKTLSVTLRYSHLAPRNLRDAVRTLEGAG
jgi:integrase